MHDLEQLRRAAATESKTQPHTLGGLRGHSIGDLYPWNVTGVANGDDVAYRPENLQTGEKGPSFATHAQAVAATIYRRERGEWEGANLHFRPLTPAPEQAAA